MTAPTSTRLARKRIAVVLAAGSGRRMGCETPKQFLPLGGHTVLEHAVEAFTDHPDIDEVVIVGPAEHLANIRRMAERNAWLKVTHIIAGGRERHESTLAALRLYEDTEADLLFHDAARPLVGADVITRVAEALLEHEVVATALPVVDTIIESNDGHVTAYPDRNALRRMQTPQGFRSSTLRRAYALALADQSFRTTDDCGVVFRYLPDTPIHLVDGDERNMKLTYPEDIPLLERFLQA